jgi:hypothetical protein
MKAKRTLYKTIVLIIARYERWKANPRNAEIVAYMEASKHSMMEL